jgi:hypothetical protein
MQDERSPDIHNMQETGLQREDDGIRVIYTSADEKRHPAEGEVKRVVDACRRLNADAVILESIDYAVVASVNVYDSTYAVAICDPGAHLPTVARDLQVRLYRQACEESQINFLPAATVRSALGRWERQIAMVFGRRYAAGLVAGAAEGSKPDGMTRDSLEEVRRRLCVVIGGCIDLQKVDK